MVVFLGLVPFVERANLRHYQFLAEGVADIADGLRAGVWPASCCAGIRTIGSSRSWTKCAPPWWSATKTRCGSSRAGGAVSPPRVRLPFWTVDADVVVPSALLLKEQYAARTMRPRIHAHLDRFLRVPRATSARVAWRPAASAASVSPAADLLAAWPIDRSVGPVTHLSRRHARSPPASGGLHPPGAGRLRRRATTRRRQGTSELSPYLHFGHIGPREVALAVQGRRRPGR